MPSLRMDPITGRWVILATERAMRPIDLQTRFDSPKGTFCPFCAGNEDATPPPIWSWTSKPDVDWEVRVIPNKFPALRVEGDLAEMRSGPFTELNGIGAHEVIIESNSHVVDFGELPQQSMADVFLAWRTRIRDLRNDPRLRCTMVFKNHGAQAGASLEHAHSQLIAMPVVPSALQEELDGSRKYFQSHGRNVFADIVRQEVETGDRVVFENEKIIAICPFASRTPFEICFLPKSSRSRFEDPLEDGTMSNLAEAVREICARLNAALHNPPYNMVLHSAPYDDEPHDYYSWHLELIPTLTHFAGFEWASGSYINPTPPELAASHLREVTLP